MSDPRMMGPPPGAGMGGPSGAMSPEGPPVDAKGMQGQLTGMRSLFNPQDIAMMVQDGEIGPQSTVIDLLGKVLQKAGVDPNGPVSQLGEMFKKQMTNADPVSKMRQLAQRSGGTPGATPGAKPFPQGRKPMVGGPDFSTMFGG